MRKLQGNRALSVFWISNAVIEACIAFGPSQTTSATIKKAIRVIIWLVLISMLHNASKSFNSQKLSHLVSVGIVCQHLAAHQFIFGLSSVEQVLASFMQIFQFRRIMQ